MSFDKKCGPCLNRGYYGLDPEDECKVCGGKGKFSVPGNPDDYEHCNRCGGRGHYGLDYRSTCKTCLGLGLIPIAPRANAASLSLRCTPSQQIEECIRALENLQSAQVPYHDERVHRTFRDVSDTITAVFAEGSRERTEYDQHLNRYAPPGHDTRAQWPGIDLKISIGKTLDLLVYFLRRLDPRTASAYDAFGVLAFKLHPQISQACVNHFRNGEYRSAVVDACIALQDLVRDSSGCSDVDGTKLMQEAFSPNSPILAFNDAATRSDAGEQEGWMYLFKGAVMALRNRRAHSLAPHSAEEAVDYITLLNILATQLTTARRTR